MKSKKTLRILSCLMALMMVFTALPLNMAYAADTFTVKFLADDGTTVIKDVTVKAGDTIDGIVDQTKAPTKDEHYIFTGWVWGSKSYSTAEAKVAKEEATFVATFKTEKHSTQMTPVTSVSNCTADGSAKFTCSVCKYEYYGVRYHNFVSEASIPVSKGADGKFIAAGTETTTCSYKKTCGCTSTSEKTINYTASFNRVVDEAKAIIDDTKTYDSNSSAYKALDTQYKATIGMEKKVYTAEQIRKAIDDLDNAINAFKSADGTKAVYTVIFYDEDGKTELDKKTYGYNETLVKPTAPKKESDKEYKYTFKAWDAEIPEKVTENKTFKAVYEKTKIDYTVIFVDADGKTISEKKDYHYGDAVTVPADIKKDPTDTKHYTFKGWTDGKETYIKEEFPKVAATVTYKADLAEEDHKWVSKGVDVTVDKDGIYTVGTKEEFTCACGKAKTGPQVEMSKDVNEAVKAAKEILDMEHLDKNADLYKAVKSAYDKLTALGGKKVASAEIKEACDAANSAVAAVKKALGEGNDLYTTYTITFVGADGKPIGEAQKCHFGEKIKVPEDPTKESDAVNHYIFDGWHSGNKNYTAAEIPTASADATYTAFFVAGTHKGGEAGCGKKPVCTVCGAEYGEATNPHTPSEAVKENEVKGTCTEKGSYELNVYCSTCGEKISTEKKEGEMGAHVEVIDAAVAATCIAGGKTEGVHCSVCNTVIKAQEDTPKDPEAHSPKTVIEAVPATCVTEGKTAKIECELCKDVLQEVKTVPTFGHEYQKAVITPAKIGKDGEYGDKCVNCGAIKNIEAIAAVKSISLSYTTYTYDGQTHKPAVTVVNSKGTKLVKDTDYTVTYSSGRKSVGTYSATVEFIGKYSGEKTLSFSIKPGKVGDIETSSSATSIKLTWEKVPGATGYRVFKYDASSKKYTKIADTDKCAYTVKKLKSGTKYTFAVRAYNDKNETVWGTKVSNNITTATKPAAPKVTLKAGVDTVTVSYGKVAGAKGYDIYLKKGDGSYKKVKSTDKTSFKISGLKSGATYYVKVRAYLKADKAIYSDYSSAVKVTTVSAPSAPSVKLKAEKKSVTVSYKAVSGAKGYEIYVKNGDGKYTKVKTTADTTYKVTGLKTGTTCSVKVRAYKNVGGEKLYSAYSAAKSVKVK